MGKFPRKIEMFVCDECEEEFEELDELTSHQEDEHVPSYSTVDKWQCVDCDEIHEEREDAYHCCE